MRVPVATYRLQLTREFAFEDARLLLPYLQALGISDVYLSPILAARAGSQHGYDVADPTRVNPELGTEEELRALLTEARDRGMGVLLDIVPNHMAASPENPWWRDMLEWGRASPYADFFDITWTPPWPGGEAKLLLPILGDHYGRVLEAGQVRAEFGDDGFVVRYFEHVLPLDPFSCVHFVTDGLDVLGARLGKSHAVVGVLSEVGEALLPEDEARGPAERREKARVAVSALQRLVHQHPEARDHLRRNLSRTNGDGGQTDAVSEMDRLLLAQHYRLSYWRTAVQEINYRRFFNITDLVGVRVEDLAVREALHERVLRLWGEGLITGLRVDHIDGLRAPLSYLEWLQRRLAQESKDGPGYVVVEKILAGNEGLPEEWPVAGTTGYDFLNAANGVYVDPAGLLALDSTYGRFTGITDDFETIAYVRQKMVMQRLFPAEVKLLERPLGELARRDLHGRDVATSELGTALVEVTACLPVYRSYVRATGPLPRDLRVIHKALALARERNPEVDSAAYDFLHRVLTLDVPADLREQALAFVLSWQQFTPPVIAKGLEDTSLYVYNRLISLNTVGGEPDQGLVSLSDFHATCTARRDQWPHTMNTTSTHDSKRGEDVRARINVLSEMTGEWEERLKRWSGWNEKHRRKVHGLLVPHRNEEMLLYQTLVGAWPLEQSEVGPFHERLFAYLVKSAREAKEYTSWHEPDEEHEQALVEFAQRILEDSPDNPFLPDFLELQTMVALYGACNGLSQLLLKGAAPGLPDFYQGTELWSLTLVDPDNRRPVDWDIRRRLIEELRQPARPEVVEARLRTWQDGRIKMHVTARILQHRLLHPELYRSGDYVPLYASGGRRPHVCGFARRDGGDQILCLAPRRVLRFVEPGELPLGQAWGESVVELPALVPGQWRNVLTGETVTATVLDGRAALPLKKVFATLPLALLEPVRDPAGEQRRQQ